MNARARVRERLLPPVMGSLIELADPSEERPFRLYVIGDTLMFPGIHKIAQRYGDVEARVPSPASSACGRCDRTTAVG